LQSLQNLLPEGVSFPPAPRMAHFTKLYQNVSRETVLIDEAVVVYFKGPHSFTGEDVIEYQIHGSPAIIQQMYDYLEDQPHHRMAERGEFTRRAFENGRMDLTEAEAVADLVEAETLAQKDQALAQMGGALKELYEGWAETLTHALAMLEADIDFPDEDLPEGVAAHVRPDLEHVLSIMRTHLNDNRRGERLRDGIHVAVIGAPNAGKSSLVNALAQRDVAIVSDFAGTTRDILEVHLNIGGYPVILSDTAGLKPELLNENVSRPSSEASIVSRETIETKTDETSAQDSIESEGIRRALERAQNADLKLLMYDASAEIDEATLALHDENSILIANKTDLSNRHSHVSGNDIVGISLKNDEGMLQLLQTLEQEIKTLIGVRDAPALTRRRHRIAVQESAEYLKRALEGQLPELIAEDVRLSVRALGRITGRISVDDILDRIFSSFCIGK
jgi:tRNA modification GTPase